MSSEIRVESQPPFEPHRHWLSVLARSAPERLESMWQAMQPAVISRLVRPPGVGLAMVRARAGGTGMRFNLGEVAVSRCAVAVEPGLLGIGYVQGRRPRHAELVAVFDALLQDPDRQAQVRRAVIEPLEADQAAL